MSLVKPLLYKLLEKTLKVHDSDASTAREVKKAIRNDLQERYQSAAVQRIMNVATFLDPHYKELPFLDVISKRRMIDDVEDELLGLEAEVHGASEEATSTSQETNEPPPKKHKGPVSKLLGDLFKEQQQTESDVHVQFVDSVLKELEMYKAEKPADLESDPLEWWYRQKSLYPLMCRLV